MIGRFFYNDTDDSVFFCSDRHDMCCHMGIDERKRQPPYKTFHVLSDFHYSMAHLAADAAFLRKYTPVLDKLRYRQYRDMYPAAVLVHVCGGILRFLQQAAQILQSASHNISRISDMRYYKSMAPQILYCLRIQKCHSRGDLLYLTGDL